MDPPPSGPEPVKLFVAALWSDRVALDRAIGVLEETWGPVDFRGGSHRFVATDYYRNEMGEGLGRTLFGFADLVSPELLVDAKLRCVAVEDEMRIGGQRVVNLDVGYIDLAKIVLASTKGLGQKLWIGRGIWADLVCRYRKGRLEPFEWTFPDFRAGIYDRELLKIRRLLKSQR